MFLEDMNPFIREAAFVELLYEGTDYRCAYDHRIFYIKKGEGFVFLNHQKLPIAKGDVLYIPSGNPYYFEGKMSPVMLSFDFTLKYSDRKKPIWSVEKRIFDSSRILEPDVPEELKKPILLEDIGKTENIIDEILIEHWRETREAHIKAYSLLRVLICDIVTHRQNHKTNQIAAKTMMYIQKNRGKNISNTELADVLGYNHIYINRVFKNEFGSTIHQFILKERIADAKKALRNTPASIDEIAESCGFVNRSQFCTSFKKETGRTPNEYRHRVKKK